MAEFLATISGHVREDVNRRRRKMPLEALRERVFLMQRHGALPRPCMATGVTSLPR